MSSTNKTLTNALKVDSALELNTLKNIIDLSKQCIHFLHELDTKRQQILLDINNNENDFFDKNTEIVTQFNALFDPKIYKTRLQVFTEELKDTVNLYCRHEYIDDLIDVDYDKSVRVTYCQLCELTRR
jgi:hypothetical protein